MPTKIRHMTGLLLDLPPLLASRLLLAGLIFTASTGCTLLASPPSESLSESATPSSATGSGQSASTGAEATAQSAPQTSATSPEPASSENSSANSPATQPDPYPDAVRRASLALTLSQSAQSVDDWQLVAGRWQQAMDLMQAVPDSSENHANAVQKITEYRGNRDYALTQAKQPIPSISQLGEVVVMSEDEENAASALDADGESSDSSTESENTAAPSADGVYRAPIVRRSGGTPVINVSFNGGRQVEMIVDTGASGTVLTRQVAQALGVRPTGQTRVSTASQQSVTFALGRVDLIEVNGARLENPVVAIAGPELETGLLGNDFFGRYDVTVKADVVEFRER